VTLDNITVIVPNSEFVSGRVVNWSHGDPRLRIHVGVGVSYASDVAHVTRVLHAVATKVPLVLQKPPPEVTLRPLRRLVARLRAPRVGSPARSTTTTVSSALRYEIRAAFVVEEIEIPYPRREVTVRAVPAES
jgi:small-conductance mechanosensitive channel